jgi:glycosyltransferase involved in cell wall biosynthesis
MGLVVLVPTLGRAHRLGPLAALFRNATPPHRIVFICDPDDQDSIEAAQKAGECLVAVKTGYSAKVNLGVRATEEEHILLAADDVRPHPGWYEIASALMSDTIGYVSLNDLGNRAVMRGRYCTFPLVARWYAELEDELYHEGYAHNYCDREATEKAQLRGAFAYAPEAIMEHLHPLWKKGEIDQTYRDWALNEDIMERDRTLFEQRRAEWTPA